MRAYTGCESPIVTRGRLPSFLVCRPSLGRQDFGFPIESPERSRRVHGSYPQRCSATQRLAERSVVCVRLLARIFSLSGFEQGLAKIILEVAYKIKSGNKGDLGSISRLIRCFRLPPQSALPPQKDGTTGHLLTKCTDGTDHFFASIRAVRVISVLKLQRSAADRQITCVSAELQGFAAGLCHG